MSKHDALVSVIDALHAEIAALKANDIDALEAATAAKLRGIEAIAASPEPNSPALEALAGEAHRLNETCRIYVNLMAANVRRRLQILAGAPAQSYAPGGYALA